VIGGLDGENTVLLKLEENARQGTWGEDQKTPAEPGGNDVTRLYPGQILLKSVQLRECRRAKEDCALADVSPSDQMNSRATCRRRKHPQTEESNKKLSELKPPGRDCSAELRSQIGTHLNQEKKKLQKGHSWQSSMPIAR